MFRRLDQGVLFLQYGSLNSYCHVVVKDTDRENINVPFLGVPFLFNGKQQDAWKEHSSLLGA